MAYGAEGGKSGAGGTEEVVLSCEFWVLSYLSRAGAKETRGTKETRETRETRGTGETEEVVLSCEFWVLSCLVQD